MHTSAAWSITWHLNKKNFKEIEFYWLCKDVPVFHHFHFREIAAFKYFFWMKTTLPFSRI